MASVDLVCRACGAICQLAEARAGAMPACACGGQLMLTAPAVFVCTPCGVRSRPARVDLAIARPCPRCGQGLVVAADGAPPRAEPTRIATPAAVAETLMQLDDTPGFSDDRPATSNATLSAFGRYQIVREIARGGMGIVYEAFDPTIKRAVALKVLIAGEVATKEAVARFVREARAAGQLRHPNIVAVHDAGEVGGQHYFTMDLIRGRELGEAMAGVPLTHALGWMHSAGLALHHAHEHGIVHRDLKPSNIMIDQQDRPIVMDFGLAKDVGADSFRSLSGAIFGTPAYMSPEQAQGHTHAVDRRTDVYALGVILYEIATGSRPFGGDTLFDTIRAVVTHEPRPPIQLKPGLPADLDTIILRCLEKRPEQRYQTALALAEDLARHLAGDSIAARPVTAPVRLWRRARHRPVLLASIGAGVIALLAGAIGVALVSGEGFVDRLARELASGDPGRVRAATTTLAGQLAESGLNDADAARALTMLRGLIGGADADAEGTALAALVARRDASAATALLTLACDAAAPAERRARAATTLADLAEHAPIDRPATAHDLATAVLGERERADLAGALAAAATRLDADTGAAALAPAAEDATRPTALRIALVRALPGAAPLHGATMQLLLRLSGDGDPAVGDAAVARLASLRLREPVFALYGLELAAGNAYAGLGSIQRMAAQQAAEAEAIIAEMDEAPVVADPVARIAAHVTGGEREVRLAAVADLGGLGVAAAGPPLIAVLTDPDGGLRRAAGRALVRLAPRAPLPLAAIAELLAHRDGAVRADVVALLGELEAREAVPAVAAALVGESDPRARLAEITALGRIGDATGLPALRTVYASASSERDGGETALACVAAFARGQAFAGAALADLIAALDHPSRAVREAGAAALAQVSGEAFGADAAAWRAWQATQP